MSDIDALCEALAAALLRECLLLGFAITDHRYRLADVALRVFSDTAGGGTTVEYRGLLRKE